MEFYKFLLLYLILIVTAYHNYKIINTQDIDDDQTWHNTQLLQWIIIYSVILIINFNIYFILYFIGYVFTYAFLYDGLLNKFRDKKWFEPPDEEFGGRYTLNFRIKNILFFLGLAIITIIFVLEFYKLI